MVNKTDKGLEFIKEELKSDESSSPDLTGSDRKNNLKLMLDFEGNSYDFFDLKRILRTQRFDEHSEDGIMYIARLMFKSYPFNQDFEYTSLETRDRKIEDLKERLAMANVAFIVENE